MSRSSHAPWVIAAGLVLATPVRAEEPRAALEAPPESEPEAEPEPEPDPQPVAAPTLLSEPVSEPTRYAASEELASPHAPRMIEDLRLGRDDDGSGVRTALWASAGVFSGAVRDDTITMGWLDVGLRLGIGREARVAFDWGVAFAETRVVGVYTSPMTEQPFVAGVNRAEARNADLTFEWTPFVSDDVRVGFGVGVAIPVAAGTRLPSSPETQAALDASLLTQEAYLAAHGGWYAWRYRPERAGLFVPVNVAIALSPEVLLSIHAAPALGLRVLGGSGPDVEGDASFAADLGASVMRELRLGLRASVSALALGLPEAAAQPAVEPWARLELAPISVLARATVGLGGPYGVGSSFVGWGAHLGASVELP